ncbi:2-hydroxyacid dehydrogenase [Paenisporosarcina antarctica]|uniref:D-glycerate dehydrogenase n=1 Tax=Paenisporosarcina antarctica TaxID=417367 RepID=A0A4P7A009_9BACL|nr:D-glycerate dehydrogenase [Paenisporosarcina antarctica]QBP41904.1 D-glycerate dehydrogenase [Paenisporosarcina antarctica]
MKLKIYITRKLPDAVVDRLREICEVSMWDKEEEPVPREVLMKEIRDVDGILSMVSDPIDETLINQATQLKVISNMAVGYNNIDIKAATERGIMVTNTPGVLTETTADLTFALLMATARRLVESSDYLREGKWKSWFPMQLTGQDIHGSTLGIIGMGRIGEALAKRAKGFDMNVIYTNRSRKSKAEEELGIQYKDKETLLRESDFVCVLVPFTLETKDTINKEELALMKPTAVLINTARGGVVNEDALYEALINKEIWAAGLDVFQEEPVPIDHPLLTLPNVVALPHIGSSSINTRMKMAHLAATNLIDGISGNTPKNLVVE